MAQPETPADVAVVGGGLAGLAAAEGLSRHGLRVTLFEARRHLGGRAGSFQDPDSGHWIDHCQHVAMECCTNFLAFCRQTGVERHLRCEPVVHFIGPDGARYDLRSTGCLPAPLHLAPWLMRLKYFSLRERRGIAQTLLRLARLDPAHAQRQTIGAWLREQGQTERAIDWFWSVVLVSALGEQLDRASASAARKVFVDGFMSTKDAYRLYVPTVPLGHLYGDLVAGCLQRRGVVLRLGTAVTQIVAQSDDQPHVLLQDGSRQSVSFAVVALPWQRITAVLPKAVMGSQLNAVSEFPSAPITGVHLWFDRPIMTLSHAVLVGRLSQWLFNHGPVEGTERYYYQVVISASRALAGRDREAVVSEIIRELTAIWPLAAEAQLVRWQMVTQRDAVFSMVPGLDERRPTQRTNVASLMLAGDWTHTGWPSTMEGAVRSGYLAAEAILQQLGRPASLLVPELPRAWLAKLVSH